MSEPIVTAEQAKSVLQEDVYVLHFGETISCGKLAKRLNALLAPIVQERERLAVEAYKKSLDVPELDDFAKGVVIEAQHQRQRWGNEHDREKEPEEWFWLVGYLAGKGLHAQRRGDMEKFRHHLITGGAVLANWHARVAELEAAAPKVSESKNAAPKENKS